MILDFNNSGKQVKALKKMKIIEGLGYAQ